MTAIDENCNGRYPNGNHMVRILLLNLKDQTKVLLEAYEKGYVMVQLLLQIGIDATVEDPKGLMPLHLASANGCDRVVQILLANRLDTAA
ncbi:hypothetical protein B0T24DRAFT_638760 [Lasiosphaeria ovina]|uniref:Ankyrin n=1 Tax=Lasiosphaeria ovina TaxID=92902 RepID=A0AAE0JUZ4_9PEZI|nr:hypothetical protein B0T24DRAFT_638760 [Lasiosphaeria ovina]